MSIPYTIVAHYYMLECILQATLQRCYMDTSVTLYMRWLASRVADSGENHSTYATWFGGVMEGWNNLWFVTAAVGI